MLCVEEEHNLTEEYNLTEERDLTEEGGDIEVGIGTEEEEEEDMAYRSLFLLDSGSVSPLEVLLVDTRTIMVIR